MTRLKTLILAVCCFMACCPMSAKPKLIVGIVVEGLRYDQLMANQKLLTEDGFKKLINSGTLCTEVYHNSFFTQSSPDYATISTGAYPSVHGVVSDQWYDQLSGNIVFSTTDNDHNSIGGYSYSAGRKSPHNLYVSTFGDQLRKASGFKSRTVSIGMDASSAIFSGGHTSENVYWYDESSGEFITSTYYKNTQDDWVVAFNQRKMADSYLQSTWNPKFLPKEYPNSPEDDSVFEKGFDGRHTFPYDFKSISRSKPGLLVLKSEVNYSILKASPMSSSLVCNFAQEAIRAMELGKGGSTDYITVSFSAIRYIGQRFGASSMEVADAIARTDEEIGYLLSFLESNFKKDELLIYLVSDHGLSENPEYQKSLRLPAGSFGNLSSISLLRSYLNAIYGEGDWVKEYDSQQIFLNRIEIENRKMDINAMRQSAAQFIMDCSGVAAVFTPRDLDSNDQLAQAVRRGYHPRRSGDVIISFLPDWVEEDLDGNIFSNSNYKYNTHVPMIWYGGGIPEGMRNNETMDLTAIAPTLSRIMDISAPNAATGAPIVFE